MCDLSMRMRFCLCARRIRLNPPSLVAPPTKIGTLVSGSIWTMSAEEPVKVPFSAIVLAVMVIVVPVELPEVG